MKKHKQSGCIWKPVIYKTGRISTMFHNTSCHEVGVTQRGANYCYFCGAPSIVIPPDVMRATHTHRDGAS